ncbi:hypothetical protein [Streptomyces sp. NPDC052107]|uniref:hypothetical protein n=1 Tax=Streptomyces sp. NPDC052107 TaxID=3155632 RepID=UPI00341BF71E
MTRGDLTDAEWELIEPHLPLGAFGPIPESTAATKTTNAVDKRSLLNPEQAAAILDWIRRRPRGGKRLHAFFATLYYCGPRPEEAVAMRVEDVTLPAPDADDQWCELLIHTATPEVGKQWTDTGEIHEQRDLKGRAEGETARCRAIRP